MIKCTVSLALAAMLSVASPVLAAPSEVAPSIQPQVIPLAFSSQEALELVPPQPGTRLLQQREFRAVSATGRHYVAMCYAMSRNGRPGPGSGGSVVHDKGAAAVVHRVVVLQFIPHQTFFLNDLTQVNVRMKDGVEGFYLLRRDAAKFPEANWAFPPDVSDDLKRIAGTTYVFKYDESDTTPLTFHLP